MDELIERLSQGDHAVEVSLRPERTVQALKECIDRGYVHIRFTATRGGTELGVSLDRSLSSIDEAGLEAGKGSVRLVGTLTLNYIKVRCHADIDLSTLEGAGRLEALAA